MKSSGFLLAALVLGGCSSSTGAAPSGPADSGGSSGGGGLSDGGDSGGGSGPEGSTLPGDSGGSPDASPVLQGGKIAHPNPIVSRGRPVTSSVGSTTVVDGNSQPLTSVNDGVFQGGDGFEAPVSSGSHPWVAIDVGAGPSRLLLTWLSEGDVDAPFKAPVDYHIDVSPDGSAWSTVSTITGNDTNAREHAFAFTGQKWVRIVVDKADSNGSTHFVEVEAYDVSNGSDDTWLFMGDSITAMAMNRYVTPDFATLINQAKPAYTPMVIDEAIGGTAASDALLTVDGWIARFPDIRNVAVAYGTNDSNCDLTGALVGQFIGNEKVLLDKLKAAGKRVFIPHIPWNHWAGCSAPTLLAPYNMAIDTLQGQDPFVTGPDLYTYFAAHQSQLDDGVHPGTDGVAAMNQMWSTAALVVYP